MQTSDKDCEKRSHEGQRGSTRIGVRLRSWFNSLADLAAFTWRQVSHRLKLPEHGQDRQRQVVQLVGLVVAALLTVTAVFFYSGQRVNRFTDQMARYDLEGSDFDAAQPTPSSTVASDKFSTGKVNLGLTQQQLEEELGGVSRDTAAALARLGGTRPETMSEEALGVFNLSRLTWPLHGEVGTGFGWWRHPMYKDWRMHTGVNIKSPVGAAVRASLPGRVVDIHHDNYLRTVVVVEHGGGVRTVYGNLQEVTVGLGSAVAQGQVIGRTAPKVTAPAQGGELYFELRHNGEAVNPEMYLR